eukprot:TRINITY_DN48450_c0_g1_i1.p1 TRINITY_DN48450_c0_g1~~TRINITY_DN48450_c0_g1_i1.p1  ORF type:complete len:972 (-),score=119.00 TRINITY_DN48450_c0_g1_i1:109-3024(-)
MVLQRGWSAQLSRAPNLHVRSQRCLQRHVSLARTVMLAAVFGGHLVETAGGKAEKIEPKAVATRREAAAWQPDRDPRAATQPLSEVRGLSYRAVPTKSYDEDRPFPSDFVMAPWLSTEWGWNARDDLGVISRLGANAVLVRPHDSPLQSASSRSDDAGEKPHCDFQWYRFRPLAVRDGGSVTQISEIRLRRDKKQLNLKGATAMTPGGFFDSPVNDLPLNAIDGSTDTKWLSASKEPLIIHLPNPTEVDSFSFVTANDDSGRDPVRWSFDASRDGKVWITLHSHKKTSYPTTKTRYKETHWFTWTDDKCRQSTSSHFNATSFLDMANRRHLKVMVGLSEKDTLGSSGACALTEDMDCFQTVQEVHAANLHNGFLVRVGDFVDYHPALDSIILVNEPEQVIRRSNATGPRQDYIRSVVSAFDGLLAAEREAGVDPSTVAVRVSASFSFEDCPECPGFRRLRELQDFKSCCIPCGDGPGLADCESLGELASQMRCSSPERNLEDSCPALAMIWDLHSAMKDPASVGYTGARTPLQTLFDAYSDRWIHSINLDGTSVSDLVPQFLEKYMKLPFNNGLSAEKMKPVLISTWRPVDVQDNEAFETQISSLQSLAKDTTNPLLGFNLVEFQVAYDQPCDVDRWAMYLSGDLQENPCPDRAYGLLALGDIPLGHTTDVTPKTGERFTIHCLYSAITGRLQVLAESLGGQAPDTSICQAGEDKAPMQYCIADRGAPFNVVDDSVQFACRKLQGVLDNPCASVPKGSGCALDDPTGDVYSHADWIFSIYYAYYGPSASGINKKACGLKGAGVLTALPPRPECTANPASISPFFEDVTPNLPAGEETDAEEAEKETEKVVAEGQALLPIDSKIILVLLFLVGLYFYRRQKRISAIKAQEPLFMVNQNALDERSEQSMQLAAAQDRYVSPASGGLGPSDPALFARARQSLPAVSFNAPGDEDDAEALRQERPSLPDIWTAAS